MNVIKPIPIESIQPFTGQPRSYFDEAGLEELAASIRTHGQLTPAWVIPLECDRYELIAGERRLRACKRAGLATLLCEVREGLNKEQQYVASVMENFGRRDCTVMETARAIGSLMELYERDVEKVATAFSRSAAWVWQLMSLLRLDPEVVKLLEPPKPRISTQVAVSLANLHPEVQLRLAREIANRELKPKAALAHIRLNATNEDRLSKKGKQRAPKADFNIMRTFLENLGPQAQAILEMGDERIQAMFKHRKPEDRKIIGRVIERRIDQLSKLAQVIHG